MVNWLATGEIDAGLGLICWQGVPVATDIDTSQMVRDFQLINIKDLPPLPRMSPEQRSEQLAARVTGYDRRTTHDDLSRYPSGASRSDPSWIR